MQILNQQTIYTVISLLLQMNGYIKSRDSKTQNACLAALILFILDGKYHQEISSNFIKNLPLKLIQKQKHRTDYPLDDAFYFFFITRKCRIKILIFLPVPSICVTVAMSFFVVLSILFD